MFSVPTLRSIARDTNLSAQTVTPNPSTLMHTDGCQPGLKRRGLRLSGPDVGLGGRVGGYEREAALVYGSSCSFTREISRATINTTVSFKGAVYHTTGFQGPQTDLVFVVLFVVPSTTTAVFANRTVAWVWIQLNVSSPSSISSDC